MTIETGKERETELMMAMRVETTPDELRRDLERWPGAPAERVLPGSAQRASTLAAHVEAVERAIQAMHEGLGEPLSLDALAQVAFLSRFHFDRVFCAITGISPCRFLAALRVAAAKRLLLTTRLGVTEICFDVGYHSIGSFTRDFTQYVGVSPSRLRQLARQSPAQRIGSIIERAESLPFDRLEDGLTGRIAGFDAWHGPIFVGLFPTTIPRGRPVRCTLLTSRRTFHLSAVPDGSYHTLSVAFPRSDYLLDYLLPDPTTLRLGVAGSPLVVLGGRSSKQIEIEMRPVQLTDPPILIALPFLLEDYALLGARVPA